MESGLWALQPDGVGCAVAEADSATGQCIEGFEEPYSDLLERQRQLLQRELPSRL